MASTLDPVIHSKLLEFRSRFRTLVFMRGLCCTLLGFLGGLLLLSIFDYFVVMEDRTRYALSSFIYLGAIITTWVMCIRPLLRVLDDRELAAMMERDAPELKSKLLSAVELAEEDREHESEVFRKQAQLTVVESLRLLVISKLLPVRLVQIWLSLAIAVVLITGIVAAFESGRALLLRALIPTANIDRVSRNRVSILFPQGGNATVPENDEIEIRIQVRGPKIKRPPYVLVERLDGQDQKASFIPDNNPGAQDEYTTTIAIESKDITYRVHAGDAVSRRYKLISRERPRVVRYEKTYAFPDYTGRVFRTIKESHGNISALTDTDVKLTLHLSQPVASAVMNLVSDTATNKLDFVQGKDPKQWVLALPLLESGAYKVHLMTAENLGNKSPVEYSVEANPDLVPTVEIAQPGVEVIAQPEDVVSIVGEVKDDVGLTRWEQLFKVDKADWKPIHTNLFNRPLITNAVVRVNWDLLKHKVKVGTIVLTKIAVVDRKGSRTESRPIRVKLDSALFDTERIRLLEERRLWTEQLNIAVTKSLEFCNILPPDQLENLLLDAGGAARRAKVGDSMEKLADARRHWRQIVDGLPTDIRKAQLGREVAGFSLIGRVGVRLVSDCFPRAQMHLTPIEGIVVDPKIKIHCKSLPGVLKDVRLLNNGLLDASRIWMAADEAAVAIDLLDYIQRASERMHRVARSDIDTDEEVWSRLSRRQAGACKELAAVQDILKKMANLLEDDRAEVVSSLQNDLKKVHEELSAKHAENLDSDRSLLTTGLRWGRAIRDACEILRPLAHALAHESVLAREKLEGSVGSTAGSVELLIDAWRSNEQAKEDLDKAEKNVLVTQAKLEVAGELLDFEWAMAQEVLLGRARLEESGKANSALFASDAAQAAAAIEAVREGVEAGRDSTEVKTQLQAIANAMAILEVGNELAMLEEAAKNLANRERWEQRSTDASSLRPRDWKWLSRKLKISTNKLRKAGLAGDKELDDLVRGAAAKAVAQEMEMRRSQAGFFVEPNKRKD